MKKLLLLLLVLVSLNSCEVYQEPSSLSLSGEYVIDKITMLSTENTTNSSGTIYNMGTHYVNPYDISPMDDIWVGFTRWHFDYSVISLYPIQQGNGTTTWQRQYFYSVIRNYNVYDLGYIQFYVNGSVRTFKILDDGLESLTLQTTGLWPYSNMGPNQIVTLHLTRIGP
jgi:hypothetical protein